MLSLLSKTNDNLTTLYRNDDNKSKKSRRVPITAPPTMSATTITTTALQTTTTKSTTVGLAYPATTTGPREISAAPVYENSNDVDNINSLTDIDDVLEYVEAAIYEPGREQSPSEVMETARACAK